MLLKSRRAADLSDKLLSALCCRNIYGAGSLPKERGFYFDGEERRGEGPSVPLSRVGGLVEEGAGQTHLQL